MSGTLLEGVEFDKGKGIRNFKTQNTQRLRTSECFQLTMRTQTVTVESCGDNCTFVTVTEKRSVLGEVCYGNGFTEDQLPPDFIVEGGGGEIALVQAVVQLDFTDLLDEPCIEAIIKQALNKSLNTNQKNLIENLIDGIYTNSIIDLKFRADNSIPYPGATIRRTDSNSGKTEIVFKPLEIDNFTKEYAVAIALHEFVHAVLASEDSFHTEYPDTYSEHVKMIKDYLPQLAQSLKAVTGLSDFDAKAITIQGFNDVIQNNRALFDEKVKAAYGNGFDVNQALSRGAEFSHYTENAQNGTGNRACD